MFKVGDLVRIKDNEDNRQIFCNLFTTAAMAVTAVDGHYIYTKFSSGGWNFDRFERVDQSIDVTEAAAYYHAITGVF